MTEPNVVRKSRFRWGVRVGVYVMLFASAAAAFFLDDRLWEAARNGTLPVWAPLLPVVTFTAFCAIYAVDRWLLVKKRHYPALRALFQVASAVVVLSLLWPRQAEELARARVVVRNIDPTVRLLGHREPDVRAAACELAGLRMSTDLLPRVSDMATTDASLLVREKCAEAQHRLEAIPAQ